MLKFLFGGKKTAPEVLIESDRARFTRLVNELNELIDTLADKPRVTIDPATGHVLPEAPEQFADEALALPAPTPEPEPEKAEEGAAEPSEAEVQRAEADATPEVETPEEEAPAKAS